jgi:hypothetical protein
MATLQVSRLSESGLPIEGTDAGDEIDIRAFASSSLKLQSRRFFSVEP